VGADPGDCDDSNPEVRPDALERPGDQQDSNCDGVESCYLDADGDGYRPDTADTVESANLSCADRGEATALVPMGDCDDNDAAVSPAGRESPGDGVDSDCDGTESCYTDADRDGYRADGGAVLGSADTDCTDAGEASTTTPLGDCDDADAGASPAATEVVGDGIDEDCDGDELCYVDADEDGYRPDLDAVITSRDGVCGGRGEATEDEPGGDCDDGDPRYNPTAVETDCTDPADYNCDGRVIWADDDEDGAAACEDCDDTEPSRYPGASERCNDLDDDCDEAVDEDPVDARTWFADADGDGYTDPDDTRTSCDPDAGYAEASAERDCDDADATSHPGGTEVPDDGIDQDCDGLDAHGGTEDTDSGALDDTGDGGGPDGGRRCGCATDGAGTTSGALLLGFAALLARRRRDGAVPTC
jgi:uncharacterized protein (TIGR03382 family)